MKSLFSSIVLLLLLVCHVNGQDASSTKFDKPSIGVATTSIDREIASFKTLPKNANVMVYGVIENSPAARAELSEACVITTINKKPVKTEEEFLAAIGSLEVGKAYDIAGLVPTFPSDGKIVWKKASTKITPQTYGDVLKGALRIKKDELKGSKIIHYSATPEFVNSENSFHLYIMVPEEGKPFFRLIVQNVGKELYAIKSVLVKAGSNETLTITPKFDELKMDLSLGKVWEWFDTPANEEQIAYMRKILASGETIIRLNGSKYSDERKLSARETAGIQVVLEAMDWLNAGQK